MLCLLILIPPTPHLQPLATTDLFSVFTVLPFSENHIVGTMQYIAISDWLLSLQYSGLENSKDCIVYGVAKSRTLWVATLSCSVMSNSLWSHRLYSSWNSPGQNSGVGSCSLLQGIFQIQGSNPGLLHCRQILYQLSHQGSPLLSLSNIHLSFLHVFSWINRSFLFSIK